MENWRKMNSLHFSRLTSLFIQGQGLNFDTLCTIDDEALNNDAETSFDSNVKFHDIFSHFRKELQPRISKYNALYARRKFAADKLKSFIEFHLGRKSADADRLSTKTRVPRIKYDRLGDIETMEEPSSKNSSKSVPGKSVVNIVKGKAMPDNVQTVLLNWVVANISSPYPDAIDKVYLMQKTGLDGVQLRNYFTNLRKRHWKPLSSRPPRSELEVILYNAMHPSNSSSLSVGSAQSK